MEKQFTTALMSSLMIFFLITICEEYQIDTKYLQPAPVVTEINQTPIVKVFDHLSSTPAFRTGKILNLIIDKEDKTYIYRIKTSFSPEPIIVSKKWFDKAQVGYTIIYREYPTEIYSIKK